jgi:hypothetical protein
MEIALAHASYYLLDHVDHGYRIWLDPVSVPQALIRISQTISQTGW